MLDDEKMLSTVETYDQIAPRYDRLHDRWLRHAGGEAQAALEALVRALTLPGKTLLDVGCGTGNLGRALLSEGMAPDAITLLDPSPEMLARCGDLPVPKVKGRLEALPFPEASFDVVTCVWALETTTAPELALQELCRVVRPGGVLCLAFCADLPARGLTDAIMRRALLRRGTGRFLSDARIVETIQAAGDFTVKKIPLRGPAATLLARRSVEDHSLASGELPEAKPSRDASACAAFAGSS